MIRSQLIMVSLITGICTVVLAPAARADENVSYEIVSDYVTAANVEYFDGSARRALEQVPLPWRTSVTVANPRSLSTDGAEIRADWRPAARPSKWVTVRLYIRDTLRCQNTLDVGNAACYGSTSFKS
jgi:hypothetical protein